MEETNHTSTAASKEIERLKQEIDQLKLQLAQKDIVESSHQRLVANKYEEFLTFNEAIRKVFKEYKPAQILKESLSLFADLEEVKAVAVFKICKKQHQLEKLIDQIGFSDEMLRHIQQSPLPADLRDLAIQHFFRVKPVDSLLTSITLDLNADHFFLYLFDLPQEEFKLYFLLRMLVIEIGSNITQMQMQNQVAESEERFRTLANNSPSLLKMAGADGAFTFFSDPWLTFRGRSRTEEKGEGWYKGIHLEDAESVIQNITANIDRKKEYEVSYRLQRADGSYRWMLEKGLPVNSADGTYRGVVASTVDITERKLREQQKNQEKMVLYSQKRLHEALEFANMVALSTDQQGNVSYCNQQYSLLTGWTSEEVIGKPIFELFRPETAFEPATTLNDLLNTFDGKLLSKNQKELSIRCNSIVLNDLDGEIASLTIVGEDITEQQKMTYALHETNELLQELFDTSHDLIMIFDESEKLLFVNRQWKQTLLYADEEFVKLKFRDIVHPDFLDHAVISLHNVRDTGANTKFATTLLTANGQPINVEGSLTCQIEEGKPLNYKAMLYDITDRLRAEKAQNLYYGIAKLVEKGIPLKELYHKFYLYLNDAIRVDSFLIMLKDSKDGLVVPFHVNSDYVKNDGIHGYAIAKHALLLDRPMFMYEEILERIVMKEGLANALPLPKVWMAVPLQIDQQTIGIIVVQSFRNQKDYNKRDLELLAFISGQMASAIVRYQHEAKISDQSARLEAIFESGSHVMWSVDKKYQITRFNQNFIYKAEGYFKFEPKRYTNLRHFYKHQGEGFFRFWTEKYRHAFFGKVQQFEVRLLNENGEEHWWEIFLNPVTAYGKENEVEEVSGVAHDITQKKLTELELAESEEKFRNIFESLQDVYFRTNMAGTFTMASPSVYELTGESQMEVLGRSVKEFSLDQKSMLYLIRGLLKNGSVKNFENEIRHKDNAIRSIISNFRLIYGKDGEPQAVEGVARDITDLKNATEEMRKAKEVAEKSLEVKRQFLSNMSHEIRTPMNGIIGMIDLMFETPLDQEQTEYISTIKKSSETLLNILNDILDLSKIEAGKMELRPMPISITKTIEKLLALFSHKAASQGTQLTFRVEPTVPDTVLADETRLLQILSNLTSNAIKFTDDGTVHIHVKSTKKFLKSHIFMFEIQDTGIGISEENLELLFKQFSQVEDSYTKSYGGTGLGLAISQELARLMNGDIGVESEVNQGSTFWFTIEVEECPEMQPTNSIEEPDFNIASNFRSTPDILLVDDNFVNLKVASSILEKAGCKVTKAQSGPKAIELAKRHEYDVILMDIQMPEMNGITATQEIKRLKPDSKTPIIAMTAFSMAEERQAFLDAGMDDYISKPIKATTLLSKIKEWVGGQDEPTVEIEKKERKLKSATPPPSMWQEPIINIEVAEDLKKYGGDELILETYADFEIETEELVTLYQEAVSIKDIPQAKGYLHTIKGTASTLGVTRLSNFAAFAEAKLKQNDLTHIEENAKGIRDRFEEFRKNYKTLLNIE